VKNLQIILNAILSKNIFEYILVDTNLNVLSASDGIGKYLWSVPKEGEDALNYLPELVGNEEEIKSIFTKKYCLYSLESVYKNEYYVNITVEYCDKNTAIILLHNITSNTLAAQQILQYSNEAALLNNTLQKVVDNQSSLLFVINEKEEIAFANQKFLDYFNVKSLDGLKGMKLKLYKYYDETLKSYDELYQHIYGHESSISIEKDTFVIHVSQIETTHKLFTLSKVTEVHKKKKRLEVELQIDALTKTYRKSYFDVQLDKELSEGNPFALVVTDIDDFKAVNDIHGHLAGDTVLKEFSTLLKDHLRQDDLLARWGGDEFLILLKRTDEENALHKVEELRKMVDEYLFSHNEDITATFGIACVEKDDDINTLLLRADKALYKAKENGKNRVILKKA